MSRHLIDSLMKVLHSSKATIGESQSMCATRARNRSLAVVGAGVLVFFAASDLLAENCYDQAPSLQGRQDPNQPIPSTQLSKDGRAGIEKLFKRMKGRWAGASDGYFCLGKESAPRKQEDSYHIVMESTLSDSVLLIRSDLVAKDNTTKRTETLRLILSDSSLRVNRDDPAGEVMILDLSRSGNAIEFLHKELRSPVTGGAGFTEIRRKIKVSATTLTIVFEVYVEGGLTSASTWKLKKK